MSDNQKGSARFSALLKGFRESKRWSQERLALESEMDHSLVSRLESRQRSPTREAIDKLALGMELTPEEHDKMLIYGGFTPNNAYAMIANEPTLTSLYRYLSDNRVPAMERDRVRALLADLVAVVRE